MKLSKLFNIGYMPRWLVICADIILTFFSTILAYLLRFNFHTENINDQLFIKGLLATLSVYLICFFALRSYREIIRHTTFRGVLRILLAVLSANIFLIVLNFFSNNSLRFVPYSVIIINFFISFFMLAGSRIAVKKLFDVALLVKKDGVIVFGAGAMGIAALETIRFDKLNDWKVLAFADDDKTKQNKNLKGIKVFALEKTDKLIKKWRIKRAIIAVNKITLERRNEVANFFIQRGIHVSILPFNQQWQHDPFKIRRLRDIKIEDLLEREPIEIDNLGISKALNNKCILITGAAGSIGSELVRQIATFEPATLLLYDIAESPLHDIGLYMQENFSHVHYKLLIGSVTDGNCLEKIFSVYKPNVVFHAAAYKHVPMMESHPHEAITNNVYGTKVVADLSVKYNASRFVMVSTDKAVNPTNVMGASKRIAEMYIQSLNNESHNTLFITTRFGNVLDSNGSVIPRFKAQLAKGGPLTVTHPDITRFFMTIPEACRLVLEAGVMGKGGEIFVFDMGESVRIKDLAEKMILLAGLKLEEDIKIQYTGLRPGEKLYEEVLNNLEITTETYHPKIKIAKVRHVKFELISQRLTSLIISARTGSEWDCVKQMKLIVPEFKSNNSKYEKLDEELAYSRQQQPVL